MFLLQCIFEFWRQNLVLGLWFWLKNANMITREGILFFKTIGHNDFSWNSEKEEPLIFLIILSGCDLTSFCIKMWNEVSEVSYFSNKKLVEQKKSYPTMTLDIAIRGKKSEDPLIFLGHFIRLWFNEFLQENMAWSFIEDFLMRMTFLLRGRNWRISNFMPRNYTMLHFLTHCV